uniref:CSLF3-cellulose synthase-like family F n=1 Tax=Arundo donax TaxID=35708 RepID=A0A0A8YZK3_ARUDO
MCLAIASHLPSKSPFDPLLQISYCCGHQTSCGWYQRASPSAP